MLALISDSRKSMIVIFYLFNLFQSPLIILVNFNGYWYNSDTSSTKAKIMINPESMRIVIIFNNFLGIIVELIKMFYPKFHKSFLNKVPETPDLKISYNVVIELVYNIIIDIMINYHLNHQKAKVINNESFEVVGIWVVWDGTQDARKISHYK